MIPGGFHFESEVKPTENLPNFLQIISIMTQTMENKMKTNKSYRIGRLFE